MNRKRVPLRLRAGGVRRLLMGIAFVCVAAEIPAAAETVTTLSTQYTAPKFVAVDPDKTVWVTDASHPLSALSFVNGAYQTPTAFGGSTAEFTSPMGVAVDSGGTVHVSNNPAGGQVGFWEALPPNYTSINGLACSCSGTPGGAALDSHGNFFVADSAAALLEITAPGYNGLVTLSAGTHPAAVAFDAQDNLFLTDQLSGSGQILELTAASGYAGSVAITSANLQKPVGIAVDSLGNLYVTDNTANTLTEVLAPDYATSVVIDNTHFNAPMGVAIDAEDNIFIADTGNNALKLIPAQPAVTGVTPAVGPIAGGNTVTISGVHLTGATAVSFGGNAAVIFPVSDTQVTATVPAGSAGTVDVRVTTPNGTSVASSADFYTYVFAPTVGAVSPNSGPTAGGNLVTITGSNFARATSVAFGGVPAISFSVLGNTLIDAAVPPGAAGTVDVAVTTPGGTNTANALYTYVTPAPTVTAIYPPSGSTLGGTGVTIIGTDLTGASAVTIGGAACTPISAVTATSLSCTTSVGSVGAASVLVTTPNGTNTANTLYTYVAPGPTLKVVDSAGRAVGYFLGGGPYCGNGYGEAVLSRTGYFACVVATTGKLDNSISPPGTSAISGVAYFQKINCSGTEYLEGYSNGGFVIADTTGKAVMEPHSSTYSGTATVNSRVDVPGGCTVLSGGATINAVPVMSNDPTITGIFAGPYAPPLSIVALPDSALADEIFFDGLESGY